MDYRKKLKKRLYYAIGYVVIGAALVLISILRVSDNEMLSAFGAAFAVCGIVRIIQHFRITRDENNIRQREIAEKDERNIMLWEKARSLTFGIFISLAGVAIIVLYMLKMEFAAQIISYTICALVFIYWICYHILSRKY